MCPISAFFSSWINLFFQRVIADFSEFATMLKEHDLTMSCAQKTKASNFIDITAVPSASKTNNNAISRRVRSMYGTVRYIILGTLAVVVFILQIARYIPITKLCKILFNYHKNKLLRYGRWDRDSGSGGSRIASHTKVWLWFNTSHVQELPILSLSYLSSATLLYLNDLIMITSHDCFSSNEFYFIKFYFGLY